MGGAIFGFKIWNPISWISRAARIGVESLMKKVFNIQKSETGS